MNEPDNEVAEVRVFAPAITAFESPLVSARLLNDHGGGIEAMHRGSILLISPHVVEDQLHGFARVSWSGDLNVPRCRVRPEHKAVVPARCNGKLVRAIR